MKIIAEFNEDAHPPLLRLYIHNAPHRRMHVKVIQAYREAIRGAMTRIGVRMPISVPIELAALFIDPSSPDLDNLLTALYQALDGATLSNGGILVDDGLIHAVSMSKYFPYQRKAFLSSVE